MCIVKYRIRYGSPSSVFQIEVDTNYSKQEIDQAYRETSRQFGIKLRRNYDEDANVFERSFIDKLLTVVKDVDMAYYEHIKYALKKGNNNLRCDDPSRLCHMFMLIANKTLPELTWKIINPINCKRN